MWNLNISGTLNVFRLLWNPALGLPHATVPTFAHIPLPISEAFAGAEKQHDIRAIVLDKDNCFAVPGENDVHPSNITKFQEMLKHYPPASRKLLIVSNTAGTSTADSSGSDARAVEHATGVHVLSHGTKKPGCGSDIMAYFKQYPESGVTHASQVCIVGDRLFTDIMLANMMGSYGLWVRDGVIKNETSWSWRLENAFHRRALARGYHAPLPGSPFE